MAFKGNSGANALAKVLTERMQKEGYSPLVIDFGEIQADGSLRTNTFPVSIPPGDYSVCKGISGFQLIVTGGAHEGHTEGNGNHNHDVSLPAVAPGNRVIVAWVQNEAVVIDVIVPAGSIRR